MAEKTTRTVYGMYLQACTHLRIPFVLQENTTLNELLGIQANQVPDAGVYPSLGYYGLGNGGLTADVGADGTLTIVPKVFKATSAAGYKPIPLVLRPLGNDLSSADRAKYALRRIEQRGSNSYIAYYLRRIDKTNVQAKMMLTTIVNGVKSSVPFVPDSSVLHPTPPVISNPGVITADGTYVSVAANLNVILDESDIDELYNVFDIVYGDPNKAVISELMMCSGLDKDIQVSDPGGSTFRMNEAIAVQVTDFVNVGAPLQFNSEEIKWSLDVGATEPLFKTDVSSARVAGS